MVCNCNISVLNTYNNEPNSTMGCTGICSSASESFQNSSPQTYQKVIWNQVRVPSSLYTMNKSAFAIGFDRSTTSTNNPSSDRQEPSFQSQSLPSHGNSLRTTITRLKPGAGMTGGSGVDIKHNSYARYLGRKKTCNLQTQQMSPSTSSYPNAGNKREMVGLISGC
jgi:hypothetical protein